MRCRERTYVPGMKPRISMEELDRLLVEKVEELVIKDAKLESYRSSFAIVKNILNSKWENAKVRALPDACKALVCLAPCCVTEPSLHAHPCKRCPLPAADARLIALRIRGLWCFSNIAKKCKKITYLHFCWALFVFLYISMYVFRRCIPLVTPVSRTDSLPCVLFLFHGSVSHRAWPDRPARLARETRISLAFASAEAVVGASLHSQAETPLSACACVFFWGGGK